MRLKAALESRSQWTVWLALIALLGFATVAVAQIHGVPASVTSNGFGGHFDRAPGIPASVTSTGSFALQPGRLNTGRGCCVTPMFPHPQRFEHRDFHHRDRYRGAEVYAVPYYIPYYDYSFDDDDQAPEQPQATPQEEYMGGPTIFDRRGPGTAYFPPPAPPETQPAQEPSPEPAAASQPVPALPATVLIFRDGHRMEVSDYAIVGETLFDLTPGEYQKISLAELDLPATQQQNDNRGVDFKLPVAK